MNEDETKKTIFWNIENIIRPVHTPCFFFGLKIKLYIIFCVPRYSIKILLNFFFVLILNVWSWMSSYTKKHKVHKRKSKDPCFNLMSKSKFGKSFHFVSVHFSQNEDTHSACRRSAPIYELKFKFSIVDRKSKSEISFIRMRLTVESRWVRQKNKCNPFVANKQIHATWFQQLISFVWLIGVNTCYLHNDWKRKSSTQQHHTTFQRKYLIKTN